MSSFLESCCWQAGSGGTTQFVTHRIYTASDLIEEPSGEAGLEWEEALQPFSERVNFDAPWFAKQSHGGVKLCSGAELAVPTPPSSWEREVIPACIVQLCCALSSRDCRELRPTLSRRCATPQHSFKIMSCFQSVLCTNLARLALRSDRYSLVLEAKPASLLTRSVVLNSSKRE